MPAAMTAHVRREGPLVIVEGDTFAFNLEVLAGPQAVSQSNDFALWLVLPLAMREGRDLLIDGPVSPVALANAVKLSEMWSFFVPALFEPVQVNATRLEPAQPAAPDARRIMCYSGGLDSTFALVRHVLQTGERLSLLTIQGMDYRPGDDARFAALMEKTRPVREDYSSETVNIRSNAASVMRRFDISSDIGFGFNAFACQFLLQNAYRGALFAADNPKHYEWARMPYGSNSMSNPLFANEHFAVETLGLDASRGEKAGFLATRPEVLGSLSICKDYGIRPDNCGLCLECVRAKALFYAETGQVPPIFLDNSFDPANVELFEPGKPNFHVVAVDILAAARRNGREGEFEALRERIVNRPRTRRWRQLWMKAKAARQARKARARNRV